ncbi:hypothetical protein CSW98_00885 [Vibrio sp. HA2012]|nr:hypothetical protein CSW98_00885 [Vibrio sp. HA2012]
MLSGCHHSSSDSSGSAYSAQAIDGYLINAEVYLDVNENDTIDAGDIQLENTGTDGSVAIDAEGSQYPIIVRAVAGSTYDSDTAGLVKETFEMYADAGSSVISPFTTIVHTSDLTLSDLAAELGVDEELLSGNYLEDTSTTADAVHLTARSITSVLKEALSSSINNKSTIKNSVATIVNAVNNAVNDGDDLDSIVIDSSGNSNSSPSSFSDFFTKLDTDSSHETFDYGNTFMQLPSNPYELGNADMGGLSFTDTTISIRDNSGEVTNSYPVNYNETQNAYSYNVDENNVTTDVLFRGNEFAVISQPKVSLLVDLSKFNDYNDDVDSETLDYYCFSSDDLAGKTYYLIYDNSDDTAVPDPQYITLAFGEYSEVMLTGSSSGNAVSITQNGTTTESTWLLADTPSTKTGIFSYELYINDLNLRISNLVTDETASNSTSIVYIRDAEDGSYSYYISDSSVYTGGLMTTNRTLADNLYAKWKVAAAKIGSSTDD